MARKHARGLGLSMCQREQIIELRDGTDTVLTAGTLDAIEAWLAERYQPARPGPQPVDPPERWSRPLAVFVSEQEAAKRRPGTIRLRVKTLTTFAHRHPGSDPLTVTRAELIDYLGQPGWTPRHAYNVRSALRVFFRLLYDLEYRRDDPARTLPAIKLPRSIPRPCPDSAVLQAFSTADSRVQLALRIAVETGMRRGEIAAVQPDDVIGRPGSHWLHVTGKGGNERTVPISDELATIIRAVETRHVFPVVGGGHITPAHLGTLVANALPDHWTVHTLRHRFATVAYQASRDLRAVQELLGHVSPVTTSIYTKVGDDSLRGAATAAQLTLEPSR